MYKTELHCHTSEVSNCSRLTAEQLVRRYADAGYTTVVLTNHLSRFTYSNHRFDHSFWSWNDKISYFMEGYHIFENAAKGKLHPILGCELRSNIDENEYLLYGVTEELLRSIPNMMNAPIDAVREAMHSIGGLFYQAHPFRNAMCVISPDQIDGMEVFNACTEDFRNLTASHWADHFGLHRSSGSDVHRNEHVISGGIETDSPITSREELVAALLSPSLTLLGNPKEPDPKG